MNKKELIKQEDRKIRRLRLMVDLTVQLLYQTENLSLDEALVIIRNARNYAISLFPEKEDTFDLIYKPRFERILFERGIWGTSRN